MQLWKCCHYICIWSLFFIVLFRHRRGWIAVDSHFFFLILFNFIFIYIYFSSLPRFHSLFVLLCCYCCYMWYVFRSSTSQLSSRCSSYPLPNQPNIHSPCSTLHKHFHISCIPRFVKMKWDPANICVKYTKRIKEDEAQCISNILMLIPSQLCTHYQIEMGSCDEVKKFANSLM